MSNSTSRIETMLQLTKKQKLNPYWVGLDRIGVQLTNEINLYSFGIGKYNVGVGKSNLEGSGFAHV